MIKKIRRTLMLQALLWGVLAWFGWKHREALERSGRAALAAWNEVGHEPVGVVREEVALVTAPPQAAGW